MWGLTASLLFRQAEVPCVDEVTPVDSSREGVYPALLLLVLFVLFPAPGASPDTAFAELTRANLDSLF